MSLVSGSRYRTRNGKLSLPELLGVIELYNYRGGAVRTRQYRLDPTNAEDGFAAGR